MCGVAFGYIRVPSGAEPKEVAELHVALAEGAKSVGLVLEGLFSESARCESSAFYELVAALKQHEVRDVIVPSLRHFAGLPGLQQAMKAYIERETGARIWVTQRV